MRAAEVILFTAAAIASYRGWIWVCTHVLLRERQKGIPGLPCDGKPLSVIEAERFGWIEDGYGQTAREPGRQR